MGISLLRPRFAVEIERPAREVRRQLLEALETSERPVVVHDHQDSIELKMPPAERHFWSPELKIRCLEEGGERTRIDGRFGPNSNLWTLFLAAYAFSAFGAFFGLMLAYSQWSLDQTASGLYVALAGALGFGTTFGVSRIGQRLADEQMQRLEALVRGPFDAY